jgi:UDP-glucuronate 4-epimerase
LRILVTGSAGFIGFHLARRLLAEGHEVLGVDGLTPYYDIQLKRRREAILRGFPAYAGHTLRLEDAGALGAVVGAFRPRIIVHLAAQAGVRYSLDAPRTYVDANLVGTFNVMELAREHAVEHLLFASSSSVYGANTAAPSREIDAADHPVSLYAATKKAGEAMTHAYSHLWGIPTTAVRFFTVYGPWGRPDMALFRFAEAMLEDRPIEVFNGGAMARDFTYIDDLVEALARLMAAAPRRGEPVSDADSLSPAAPWRVVNIGRGDPASLMAFIGEIERALGRRAAIAFGPMQAGDVTQTCADIGLLEALTAYRPDTPPSRGVPAFCAWLQAYRADHDAADRA